ncbi:hypothetical protein ETAA8_47580 [Anatilimnocola aggregata]|uniref:Ribosomal protein L7/L12 n=1 Tax=Anatilimnocola aggregata TaxID=2528021 RepID=A0A517YHF3_9BACT|nr:hypothetical protein [Anatilimnocola aggregata]QDU29643.1 hypothetical protein ETAA8_47580 [Anatilimnocola aggregata]
MNDALLDEVLALLAQNKKLEAIKLLKETLGLGLPEAKQAIDQLQADNAQALSAVATPGTTSWEPEARELLKQGQKLRAIKLGRERTGCNLRDAKEKVESLAAEQGITPKQAGGCVGVLLLLIGFLAMLGSLGWSAVH